MTEAATSAPYPIITIQPSWVLEQEAMGSKAKFWFRESNDTPDWLFKYPQANTGQHWAEKIAAEIADALNVLHARVELAIFQGVQGSATESFAPEGRELFHGNQVLAGTLLGYDRLKRFRQSDHTLSSILAALDGFFRSPESARAAKERIAEYLVLDALIGNTDRHHENWGILRESLTGGSTDMVAPSFDHASSLGRELQDEGTGRSRRRILSEDGVGRYAERGSGAIYWDPADRRGVSPLELIRRAAAIHPEFRRALSQLDWVKEESLERIVERVPPDWMSDTARSFAVELLRYSLKELREVMP